MIDSKEVNDSNNKLDNNRKSMKMLKILIKRIIANDPLLRFEILCKIGKILFPKYRFKWPQLEWWDDIKFNKYLIKFNEIDGKNTDRHWMQYQLMRLVRDVPGNTAECGVYAGAGSYIICKVNKENELLDRTHYIFDSFEGLSNPLDCDGEHWIKGDMTCSIEVVKNNLSEFSNISMHKGWIPERFKDVENLQFCFVHIDVDLYQPTFDSIKFFYSRMNEGGLIVCDDYGFTSCPGATKAIDQFLSDKKEKMISLSCGGGFLIKGKETSKPLNVL
jgi:O-methyltransferase